MGVWPCFQPVTDQSMSSSISYYHCVLEWAVVGEVRVHMGYRNWCYLSHDVRKPDFCICKNKDADQLRGCSAPLFSLHG